MCITAIETRNWLGLPFTRLKVEEPVVLVAGPNGSGKSSLHDAVRFALLGEPARKIRLKGDYDLLLSDGAKDGGVTVYLHGVAITRSLPKAELDVKGADGWEPPAPLPYILDAHRLGGLSERERREFLSGLLGVTVDPDDVGDRLIAAGVTPEVAEQVKPLLRTGFDAAEKHAAQQATEARGAWKAITGEVYGEKKAEDWTAPAIEPVSSDDIAEAEARVTDAEAAVALANQGLGASKAVDRAALQKQADALGDHEARLARGRAKKVELETELAAAREAAASSGGLGFKCPCCDAALIYDRGKVSKAPTEAPPVAHKRVPELEAALREVNEGIAKLEQRIGEARGAKELLQGLALGGQAEDGDEDPEQQQARVKAAVATLDAAKIDLHELKKRQAAARDREQVTVKAADHHAAAKAWRLAQTQLAPDGIPAVLMAKALQPLNVALREASDATGWPLVTVGRDFTLRYGERIHALCSESEQWRADAMLAAAIARLADIPLVMLDRLDVLEPAARGPAIAWFRALGEAGTTVIVTATLKQPPTIGGVQCVWLGEASTTAKEQAA